MNILAILYQLNCITNIFILPAQRKHLRKHRALLTIDYRRVSCKIQNYIGRKIEKRFINTDSKFLV